MIKNNFILLLSIFLMLNLSSCDKKVSLGNFDKVVGDYDWDVSLINSTSAASISTSNMRFGLRIKKSGKVFFYKDSEKIVDGQVEKLEIQSDGSLLIKINKDHENHNFYYKDNDLTTVSWPVESIYNHFVKVK